MLAGAAGVKGWISGWELASYLILLEISSFSEGSLQESQFGRPHCGQTPGRAPRASAGVFSEPRRSSVASCDAPWEVTWCHVHPSVGVRQWLSLAQIPGEGPWSPPLCGKDVEAFKDTLQKARECGAL